MDHLPTLNHRVSEPSLPTLAVTEHPVPPDRPTHGVVVLGHAMMADQRTLDRQSRDAPPGRGGLASVLARAGLHGYRFDVRGHGQSDPAAFTYRDSRDDLARVVAFAAARHPDLPIAVLGHSLTGHGALVWLAEAAGSAQGSGAPSSYDPVARRVRAVVALGANLWLPTLEPSRTRWWLKRALLALWRVITEAAGRFPARALGLGSADVSAPFVREFTDWAARGVCVNRHGEDVLATLGRLRLPVLAVLGGRDRLLCHPDCGRRFVSLAQRSEVLVCAPADHMGLVAEPARPAWEQIAAWLVRHLREAARG